MGGGNSTILTVNDITESISSTVISISQQSTQKAVSKESLTVNCTQIEGMAMRAYNQCLALPGNAKYSATGLATLCDGVKSTCSATNIDMKQVVSVKQLQTAMASSKSSQATKMASNIKAAAAQKISGPLNFDEKLKEQISDLSETASSIMNTTSQTLTQSTSNIQKFKLVAGLADGIIMSQATDIVSKALQASSEYTKQAQDVATGITASASQSVTGLSDKWIIIIVACVIGFLIIVGLTIWLVKKLGHKKPKADGTEAPAVADDPPVAVAAKDVPVAK